MYYSVTKPCGNDITTGLIEQSPQPMGMAHSLEAPVWTSNPDQREITSGRYSDLQPSVIHHANGDE